MGKIYKFEVRKIVSCIEEVEADSVEEALDKIESDIEMDNRLSDDSMDEAGIDYVMAADVKRVGTNKWRPLIKNIFYKIVRRSNK